MNINYFRGKIRRMFFRMNYPGNSAVVIIAHKMNEALGVMQLSMYHKVKVGKGMGASVCFSFGYSKFLTAVTARPVPLDTLRWRYQNLKMTARLSKRVFSRTKERLLMEEIKNVKLR